MDTDFCVIGGGIAGLSIASELAGIAEVTVLERESNLAYHTTGRSAALYSELVATSTALALTKLSRSFLIAPPDGFIPSPLHRDIGSLFTATASEEGLIAETIAQHSGLKALDEKQMLSLMPHLKTGEGHITAGLLEPGAFKIDVAALVEAYRKQLLAQGGQIQCKAEVTAITPTDQGWDIQLNNNASFSTKTIVNAAGAWGDVVAQLAGVTPLGLSPMRRTMIIFNPPENCNIEQWPAVGSIKGGYYFLPEAGQVMGSSADEVPSPPCDAQPEEYDIALAAHSIESNTSFKISRIEHKWAGLRTFSPDRQLVAGYDLHTPNFFWFVGQGGAGIQSAPAAAQAAAALAGERPLPMKFEALGVTQKTLSPHRFG